MDIGSFQFLTSLLEFAAALNLGFAISEGFRSQPRKNFEKSTQRWIKLQASENGSSSSTEVEKRVEADIAKSKADGEVTEGKRVIWCRRFGVVSLALSMIVSLMPLPFFTISSTATIILYVLVWLFICASLCNIAFTYKCLRDFWQTELNHIERAAKIQADTDLKTRIEDLR